MPIELIYKVSGMTKHFPGEIISLDEAEEKRLVSLGIAKYANSGAKPPDYVEEDAISPEEYERLYTVIDKAANKEMLIQTALQLGVELTDEEQKTKKATIDQIIEQGFDEEILAELQKGE